MIYVNCIGISIHGNMPDFKRIVIENIDDSIWESNEAEVSLSINREIRWVPEFIDDEGSCKSSTHSLLTRSLLKCFPMIFPPVESGETGVKMEPITSRAA